MVYNLEVEITSLPESIKNKLDYLEETGVLQYYIANLILSHEYNEKEIPRVKPNNSRVISEKREVNKTVESRNNGIIEEIEYVEVHEEIELLEDEKEEDDHEYDEASLEFLKNMGGI